MAKMDGEAPFKLNPAVLASTKDLTARIKEWVNSQPKTTTQEQFMAFIYLWTRDAKMPVDDETASYIRGHLEHLGKKVEYSDTKREQMARRLVEEWA